MKSLSIQTSSIAASMTVAIDTLAKKLKAAGQDIVSLGAGEPDFQTPTEIRKAAIDAIELGKTKYVAPIGLEEVRKAVTYKLKKDNQLSYEPNQIILTSGAKQAVFNSLAAIVNPGDEIIIPAPYWVTYPELVKWFNGVPVFIETSPETAFKITPEQLQVAITPKTKAIILNNPCNPSGAVYSKEELQPLTEIIVANDLYCISDEIYEHFCYEKEFVSLASFPQMYERTILINGFSKSHCMTGWRIGYNALPESMAPLISKIQSQAIHHPSTPAQYGALAAIQSGNDFVYKMRDTFKQRRCLLQQKISESLGNEIPLPEGAFYLFVPVNSLYGKKTPDGKIISDSVTLCSYLLESVGLAIVPGAAFGMDSCVRFSYAAAEETLLEAAKRFNLGIQTLR